MDNYIGMKLDGRYELLELIGTGGMAEIYKADDIAEDKTVAVKILKNEFAGSEEFLRRFRNESKAIALLSHPNIVKIFDVGFTESVQFIVMEYIDGITLIDYIERQGVLKWREALGFVRQILKALQHAHDRGIVHRDVKSQNVMLLRDGTIKVMDFGIARFNREIDKTMSEKAIGSVHYISPEQARGDITDEKSDLYSVGVMLYEMLTGIKPFDGDDALAIALMHTNKNPKRLMEVNSSIPEGLEEITLRAMQKEPVKRYQTAGEMLNDLQEFEKNPSIIFEYKYSTPDGNTKYFDKVGKPAAAAAPVPLPIEEPYYDDEDDYDDDEVAERRSPLLPILFAVASAVVIVAAVVVALLFGGVIEGGEGGGGIFSRKSPMPELVGMDYDEAERLFDWLQIVAKQEFSNEYPKDTIMWQDILIGKKVPSGTVVNVTVSKGEEVIYFPDYDSTLHLGADVVEELRDKGLEVMPRHLYSDDVPESYYVRSDRNTDDKLYKGDRVTVFISMGKEFEEETTKVPDMFGSTESTARGQAANHRLIPSVSHEESSEEMRGRVIRQKPEKNTEVDSWSVIEIVIGKGPPDVDTTTEVRASHISFTVPDGIPDSWLGDYEFKRYVDNVLSPDSVTVRIRRGEPVSWAFENSGVHNYSITIRNPRNGIEADYCEHKIDFTLEEPGRTVIFSDTDVLSKLNPVVEQTTVATTSAPPVTTEEDPFDPFAFP